jgi:formylmethanofuran dehydrogenase subunit C
MSLTLKYLADSSLPVDLEGVTPFSLRAKSLDEIRRLEVLQGNRRVSLGDLFQVSGDHSDAQIRFDGDLRSVHHIGSNMDGGEIVVNGDAGHHLGAGMASGTIAIAGNSSDWVGAEMKGGVISIRGSVGDHAGAAYPGSKRGMTEGSILIRGGAGHGVGRSMRRGLVAIGGTCGGDLGFGMIAGTILAFGACRGPVGAEMRRGTIGLFGPDAPPFLPTFRRAGRFRPRFLSLIERELNRLGFEAARGMSDRDLTLYHGDLLSLAKGEVWTQEDGVAR